MRRTTAHPRADLVVLRRSQDVQRRGDGQATQRDTSPFRLHLRAPHRVRHPGSRARTASCQQARRAIRCYVIKRKISGGTRSGTGRDCRDACLGLMHTCTKLGIAFGTYLGDRIGLVAQPSVPPLAHLIRCRGQPA